MPVLILVLQRWFGSESAELTMARHTRAAPDEAGQLASDLRFIFQGTGLPTPALDQLIAGIPGALGR
jgi:hypothetical protein